MSSMYKTWVLSIAYILFKKMLVQRAGVALWRAGVAGGGGEQGWHGLVEAWRSRWLNSFISKA